MKKSFYSTPNKFKLKLSVLLFFFSIFLTIGIITTFGVFIYFIPGVPQNLLEYDNYNNNIRYGKRKFLSDLNLFTFRNHSFYRYNSIVALLDESPVSFQPISTLSEKNNEVIITASPYNNNEFKVECGGTCKCYVDEVENQEERKISSLVYSYRYTSIVLVSVLGFASAKFVDQHIEECYDEAKRIHNGDRSFLSCSMESIQCNTEEVISSDQTRQKKEKLILKLYQCNGHCIKKAVTSKNFQQPAAQEAMNSVQCEKHYAQPRLIEITDHDHIHVESLPPNRLPHPIYTYKAIQKYRSLYLVPHCKTYVVRYWYENPAGGQRQSRRVSPCSAGSWAMNKMFSNIKCKMIVS